MSQEFEFGNADFERVRQLIYQRAGISLHDGKHAMVYSRVSRRLRENGHASFRSYLDWLEKDPGNREWQEFINCLTTNLTSFFREEHHFELLPQDLRACRSRPIRVWCSAASTGEEPWSIAMTVVETLGDQPPVTIVASDIDTKVLEKASWAVYPVDVKGLTPERKKRHFLRGTGANEGRMKVKPGLTRLVEYRTLNLMSTDWRLGEPMDVVFCRNVMIYFDNPTQRKVLERMHAVMRPGALLYAGHSENFSDSRDLFRLRGKTVYERV
jgi:chemotaxis protein methyltransferase CheR